ncbi:phage tail protein [Photobacterium sp. MCCC 1A19761]|uniref:phage tail protein n=1 Tax=Photobacterium sp. MCCC 1A19761 TaxID=3115000 RepID=UPI00307E17E2
MGLVEFKWVPVRGGKIDEEPRVQKLSFGDGYEQRSPNGINHQLQKFSYTFRYRHEEITSIRQFLFERGGVEPFIIYPTDEPYPTKVICEKWSRRRISATDSELTATFEEVIA